MVVTTQPNDVKERLSVAYVTAVAAKAGCQISKLDIDKQSIDATVRPISGRKVSIDLQLKATSKDCLTEDSVIFDLPINNYNDLRDIHSTAPHYLVVLVLDHSDADWLSQSEDAMLIRRCAYWLDLRGAEASANATAVRIKIPRCNQFDPAALSRMMSLAFASLTGGAA
jgi:hypothetical protein